MPYPLVVGNWKMNTNFSEAGRLAAQVRDAIGESSGVEVVLCPPSIYLAAVRDVVGKSSVKVGAQNMHFEVSGAFTGEISPQMIQKFCDFVILGHSERRQFFGETDDSINRKIKAALLHGLRPILCVGETLKQRESGQAKRVVSRQIRSGLVGVVDITQLIVAYEPVWAIGTGMAASPVLAADFIYSAVQGSLRLLYGETAEAVPLLYGGSVSPDNLAGFVTQECIHGALVGGASLHAEQFAEMVQITSRAKRLHG
jgi:triosephosphate isomerase